MSNLRMLQPDSSDPLPQPRAISKPDENPEPDAAFLARLTNTLAAQGGGAASVDLALDLVLNQIVEQARLATTATAAAIALSRGDEMVCRATTGPNAPDLGLRVPTRSGLSGACVSTKKVQRCDDTETDPRVDKIACRDLEIRSILVVPVLDGGELVGVFEIFSHLPNAFGDRDVQTLEALSLRIVRTIHRAAEGVGVNVAASAAPEQPLEVEASAEVPVSDLFTEPEGQPTIEPPRDYWTTILTAIVVGLALLLGWMIGRASWQTAMGTRSAQVNPKPDVQTPEPPPSAAVSAPQVVPGKKASTPNGPTAASTTPDTSLVVYEGGKVIFRMSPASKTQQSIAPAAAASHEESAVNSGPVALSADLAGKYLIERVEPEYPEEARAQRIQGDVSLDATVAKDGVVREVKPVSGDAKLSAAAVEAVRQWRFKPYSPKGQPLEFQTRIVVRFVLP